MSSGIRAKLTISSIRAQLTLWYLAMLAAALGAFAGFVFLMRADALYREADADLEIHVHRLVEELRPALLELDVAAALAGHPLAVREPVVVRGRSGEVLFQSDVFPPLGSAAERALFQAVRAGDRATSIRDRDDRAIRVATMVVERTGTDPLIVQVAASTDAVRRILRQLALAMALFFVVVLSIASYGGSFIARRALRPVDEIVGRVREIQASRLGERLDLSTGSEELDRLVATLNEMLDRLEISMHGARRFAADASHELQTPIAGMRAALDVCLGTGRRGIESCAMASDLVVEVDRVSTLVRDLRLLALADAGHLVDRPEDVDLAAVTRECCEIVRAVAEPKQIVVSLDVAADITVRGSALHLRRALLNLAVNAVRYSPEGSAVHIMLGRLDDEAVIAIVDEGSGISEADLPHIFERFYRADPARARDTGGTGLGLAIADQIVRSHGGRIEVSSAVDEGSTFTVFLPFASASDLSPDLQPAQMINAR